LPQPVRSRSAKVRFDVFEVDVCRGELRRDGKPLALQEKPLQLLLALVENSGVIVTREELRNRLWPTDTYGSFDDGLNTAIRKLRQALNDSAEAPRFIETIPKRGYRFVAAVEIIDIPASSDSKLQIHDTRGLLRWVIILSATALMFAAILAVSLSRLPLKKGSPEFSSLVVLPLEQLSGDATQEYFADGMTDALITDLARFKSLSVISRTSSMRLKGKHLSTRQIADQLGVDAIVEGTVTRSGNRVRITAQLIDAHHDRHLWARTYERDLTDILGLQAEIAESIAQQIKISLSPAERARAGGARSVIPVAYEAYLRGQYQWGKYTIDGWDKAIGEFRAAIDHDPYYADPYVGLANCYILLAAYGGLAPREGMPQGIAAAKRALEIDPNTAEAHYSLGFAKAIYEYDWAGAEAEFRQGLDGNPNYAIGRMWHSLYLSMMGRHAEAIAEQLRARALDPVSLIVNTSLCRAYVFAEKPDEAIAECTNALELDSHFQLAYQWLMVAYEEKQMYDSAIQVEQKALIIANNEALADRIAGAYQRGGRRAQLELELGEELSRPTDLFSVAGLYAQLGQKDHAFAYLEKAYSTRDVGLPLLAVSPTFRDLRSDARFLELLKRMNLPQ
jgi:TolB-like protein/DNA-binding winged helix-turn-helix (wHTH) protein